MAVEPATETNERINLFMPSALRDRLRQAANKRRTSEASTLRWLLEQSLDLFERNDPEEL